jgi:cytidine deaminase
MVSAMTNAAAPSDDQLIARAREMTSRSHAPYSKFRTGAVVVTADGGTVEGTIVENVSLGLAMCAERVALFGTVARDRRPTAVALAAPSTRDAMTWPCGACLQVALELGGPEMRVIVADDVDGPIETSTVAELLPRGPHVDR